MLFKWLMHGPEDVSLNKIDSGDPEVGDYSLIPDTALLSENVKVSLLFFTLSKIFTTCNMFVTFSHEGFIY